MNVTAMNMGYNLKKKKNSETYLRDLWSQARNANEILKIYKEPGLHKYLNSTI